LRRLEGAGSVTVDLKIGQAVVLPVKGKSFDPTRIPKAVKDAGFTPGEIAITAVGTLAGTNELRQLEMPGLVLRFILAGGAKIEELKRQSDLLGKRLRVSGRLHPAHGDRPPGLTVERWTRI
jgi:hypothetical protein